MLPWTTYPRVGRLEFFNRIASDMSADQIKDVERAYRLAKYGHRGKYRIGGSPRYFEHPKAVAWILIDELGIRDHEMIIVALVHDLVEDEFVVDLELVERIFGPWVAKALGLVSRKKGEDGDQKILESGDWRVILIKLADNLHNLRTLHVCSADMRKRQAHRSKTSILPMVDRLAELVAPSFTWKITLLKIQIIQLISWHEDFERRLPPCQWLNDGND